MYKLYCACALHKYDNIIIITSTRSTLTKTTIKKINRVKLIRYKYTKPNEIHSLHINIRNFIFKFYEQKEISLKLKNKLIRFNDSNIMTKDVSLKNKKKTRLRFLFFVSYISKNCTFKCLSKLNYLIEFYVKRNFFTISRNKEFKL